MKYRYIITGLLAAMTVMLSFLAVSQAEEAKKAKVLYFNRSQGHTHGPVQWRAAENSTVSGEALKKYCADKNIELTETQDGRVFDGDISQYDGFVLYATGNVIGKSDRDNDICQPLSKEGFTKFMEAIRGGKGFVGIHGASDSYSGVMDEDGKDVFTRMIGGRFCGHGPMQNATVTFTDPVQFPWMKKIEEKKSVDFEEWYANNKLNTDMHVVMVLQTEGMEGGCYNRVPYPAAWVRMEGAGRVAYTTYGHDNAFFAKEENLPKVGDLIEWSIGRFDVDTTTNFDAVTPGADK